MAEKLPGQQVAVWLFCNNRDEDHRACMDESEYCLPGAAAGAAADAEAELHRRARGAGWLVDLEGGRVLCPACSGQAGGGT